MVGVYGATRPAESETPAPAVVPTTSAVTPVRVVPIPIDLRPFPGGSGHRGRTAAARAAGSASATGTRDRSRGPCARARTARRRGPPMPAAEPTDRLAVVGEASFRVMGSGARVLTVGGPTDLTDVARRRLAHLEALLEPVPSS